MLRGSDEGGESNFRPASSCDAFLAVSTEETRKRLGMVEVRGLHLSSRGGASQYMFPNDFARSNGNLSDALRYGTMRASRDCGQACAARSEAERCATEMPSEYGYTRNQYAENVHNGDGMYERVLSNSCARERMYAVTTII